MATNRIKDLVFAFMDMVKIETKEVVPNVWWFKVPEKEQNFFNGFEELKFTFEREIAEQHRDTELICDGSFLLRKIIERLAEVPKASRMFATCKPEIPPVSDGGELRVVDTDNVYYRQKVIFNFKVQFECDQRKEMLFSISADPADSSLELQKGLKEIDLSGFSEKPQDGIKIEESGQDVLRLYLQACQNLEKELETEIAEVKNWGKKQCDEELEKFEAYLEEQKQELLKKKENVCFHLYFFQKEEEIDTLINNLEQERMRKISELQEKFSLKVRINLINAVILCIPTVGTLSRKTRKTTAKVRTPGKASGLEAKSAV